LHEVKLIYFYIYVAAGEKNVALSGTKRFPVIEKRYRTFHKVVKYDLLQYWNFLLLKLTTNNNINEGIILDIRQQAS
jgi:hypothetical protein